MLPAPAKMTTPSTGSRIEAMRSVFGAVLLAVEVCPSGAVAWRAGLGGDAQPVRATTTATTRAKTRPDVSTLIMARPPDLTLRPSYHRTERRARRPAQKPQL